ncbi:MAG TPA: hypothetical protein VK720_00240 [Terracidiphilus sp.]|jgi:hypothetical protein|nr:hypothetical protein [Terracidiphilus sp.]
MELFADAMSGVGVVLLPVAAGLLLEELTFGGLVRLLLAPRPGTKGGVRGGKRLSRSSSVRGRGEPMNRRDRNKEEMRGAKCLR